MMDKYKFRFPTDLENMPGPTDSVPHYYVPAGSLGFSVMVFICVAITCIVFLVLRRIVVKGELGGSQTGRLFSCVFLCSLWFIYVIMSIL
jgi:hypothetical protein